MADDVKFYLGDCLNIMRMLPSNSVHSIVCDPPYGLSFMGKNWDHGVPGRAYWEAALRVAKPGAMLLAFGGTRTYHRLTCAIEDAGWQIRDCLMWLYGSGFPKSLDIGKAIDKAAGAEREVVGYDASRARLNRVGKTGYDNEGEKYDRSDNGATLTAPATDAAKQWDGWGTALKPAWEPIVLAMKPLDGTFANNALVHGVAGINVDASRIGTLPGDELTPRNNKVGQNGWKNSSGGYIEPSPLGRWPANVLLDEESAALLDQMSGVSRFFYVSKASKRERGEGNNHPTVKPLQLMRYLVQLVTPIGGTVLDPFVGSGTTMLAALEYGCKGIGIEKMPEYLEIAKRRVAEMQEKVQVRDAN